MSSFGEIVEPSSRAVWEDWDELKDEQNQNELNWQRDTDSPEEIKSFLVLEGKFLSDCIIAQTHNLILINAVPEANLLLYKSLVENKYICTIKDYDLVLSSEIVELLRPYLVIAQEVIAMQTKSFPEYQAIEYTNEDCVIRKIATTKTISTDFNFPKLEQPNIISGISAGVITLKEHLDEPGVALVCFMEHPEESQVEPMEALLEKLSISSPKTRPSSVLNSNLYI